MSETAFGSYFPPQARKRAPYVDAEVHDGVRWVSMNDHYNYVLGARTRESVTQSLKNHSVESSMYDGEFIVHSTKSNVSETIEVYVLGADQLMVGDNIERLVEAFTQPMYNMRFTIGADREVWRCWPAEYALQRGHINLHNTRATITFSVPRFPKITREVME